MSLSTIAILNSVKKAVESNSKRRNRSLGVLPFTLNSESGGRTHGHGKSCGGSRGVVELLGFPSQTLSLQIETVRAFSFLFKISLYL